MEWNQHILDAPLQECCKKTKLINAFNTMEKVEFWAYVGQMNTGTSRCQHVSTQPFINTAEPPTADTREPRKWLPLPRRPACCVVIVEHQSFHVFPYIALCATNGSTALLNGALTSWATDTGATSTNTALHERRPKVEDDEGHTRWNGKSL